MRETQRTTSSSASRRTPTHRPTRSRGSRQHHAEPDHLRPDGSPDKTAKRSPSPPRRVADSEEDEGPRKEEGTVSSLLPPRIHARACLCSRALHNPAGTFFLERRCLLSRSASRACRPATCRSPGRESGRVRVRVGQASVDDAGKLVPDTIEGEVRRSFENVRRILAAAGLSLSDVVQVRAYVAIPPTCPSTPHYRDYFSPPFPARSTITSCLARIHAF